MKSPRRGRSDRPSVPSRSLLLGRRTAGMTLLQTLERIAHIPRPQAIDLLRGRHVRVDGQVRVQPAQRVRPGQRLEIGEAAAASRRGKGRLDSPVARAPKAQPPKSQQKEAAPLPPIASEIEVVYQDAHILVVN